MIEQGCQLKELTSGDDDGADIGPAKVSMKYDDASWHYGGDFPAELPQEAGATHIAMFVAWAVMNGLAGEYHTKDAANNLALLHSREVTPTEWFRRACDEKFTDEDLDEEGNLFAAIYYGNEEGLHSTSDSYLNDYSETFPIAASLYHVEGDWVSFDVLAPHLKSRLADWRNTRREYSPPIGDP